MAFMDLFDNPFEDMLKRETYICPKCGGFTNDKWTLDQHMASCRTDIPRDVCGFPL